MEDNAVFRKFHWQDNNGLTWNIEFCNESRGFSGFAVPNHQRGTAKFYVTANSLGSQRQPMAFLDDVFVDEYNENRGLGSMLVREVIEECKLRGHKGISGDLRETDRVRFAKLKHFYEKLGFSVEFYDETHSGYGGAQAGKIEMIFDNTNVSGTFCPM